MSDEVTFIKAVKDIEADIPMIPLGWRVLIRPYEAPDTVGEIAIPEEAQEAEALLTYVGQVVAMGSECYKAITRSGIDLSKVDPKPKVGDWVIYGAYGGTTIMTKTGIKYLAMNDDCLMGIAPDPTIFRAYL